MPIVKVELPSKEAAAAESPRIRGNVKDQEHNGLSSPRAAKTMSGC